VPESGSTTGAAMPPTFKAAKDAFDVAVDDRDNFPMGDAGDGCGGVCTNAGERAQIDGGDGEVPFAVCCEKLGCLMEHARAAIVAKAAPLREDVLFRGEGQRNHGGKASEKRVKSLDDNGNARLLEHDF
jgi:hypothetical protein